MSLSPQADPWADPVDLESLNAEVTDRILEAVNRLRRSARAGAGEHARQALVAVGPAGAGKTHLFSRLRRRLGPRAVLVHVRPLVAADTTPRFLLSQVVEQLSRASHNDAGDEQPPLRQIDVLVGSTLAARTGPDAPRGGEFPNATLVQVRALPDDEREELLEAAVDEVRSRNQNVDASYLERLLRVPFEEKRKQRAMLDWLAGRELDDLQAERIGLREPLAEGLVIPALRSIAAVCAKAAPLLLVFDQLENLADEQGRKGRVLSYGNLMMELVDVVQDLVIVQMGLSSEWAANVVPGLSASQRDRVLGPALPVALPTSAQGRDLLRLWASQVESHKPFPWPFTQAQVDALCAVPGTTPRMLLHELQRVLDGGAPLAQPHSEPPPVAPAKAAQPVPEHATPLERTGDTLQREWAARLGHARTALHEASERDAGLPPEQVFDALLHLARSISGVEAAPETGPDGADRLRLRSAAGERVVTHLHESTFQSLGKRCEALAQEAGTARPVLVFRERWRDLKPTWKATLQKRDALLATPGVEWRWLERADAEQLLALSLLRADAADLSGPDGRPFDRAEVHRWIAGHLAPSGWPLSRWLLGESPQAAEPTAGALTATPPTPTPPATPGRALAALQELRVASLERLVTELSKTEETVSRAQVRAELQRAPGVRFFGESVVACADTETETER